MFKKSKEKTSVKGSTVKLFKKKIKQRKTLVVAKPTQKKQEKVATPVQNKTQQIARRPQKRQMAVPTPTQISNKVVTPQEHWAKAKKVLAYVAGLTKSARADKERKEATLAARLKEATR